MNLSPHIDKSAPSTSEKDTIARKVSQDSDTNIKDILEKLGGGSFIKSTTKKALPLKSPSEEGRRTEIPGPFGNQPRQPQYNRQLYTDSGNRPDTIPSARSDRADYQTIPRYRDYELPQASQEYQRLEQELEATKQQLHQSIVSWNEINAEKARLEIEKGLLQAQIGKDNESASLLEAIGKVSTRLANFYRGFNTFYEELFEQKTEYVTEEANPEYDILHDILASGEEKIRRLREAFEKLILRAQGSRPNLEGSEGQEANSSMLKAQNMQLASEVNELRDLLQRRNEEIRGLNFYVSNFTKKLKDLEKERNDLTAQLRGRGGEERLHGGSTEDNTKVLQVFELLDGTLEVILSQEEMRNLTVHEKFTEIQSVVKQYEDLKQAFRGVQEEKECLEVTLSSVTNKLKAQQSEIEFLNRQIDNMRAEFAEFIKMDELKHMDRLKQENDSLKKQIGPLVQENVELKRKIEALTKEMQILLGISKAENHKESGLVESDIQKLRSSLQWNIQGPSVVTEDKNREIEKYEQRNKELLLKIEDLSAYSEDLGLLIATLKEEARQRDGAIDELIQQMSALINLNEELSQRLQQERGRSSANSLFDSKHFIADLQKKIESFGKKPIDAESRALEDRIMVRGERIGVQKASSPSRKTKQNLERLLQALYIKPPEEYEEEDVFEAVELGLKKNRDNFDRLRVLVQRMLSPNESDWAQVEKELRKLGINVPKENRLREGPGSSGKGLEEENKKLNLQLETMTNHVNNKESMISQLMEQLRSTADLFGALTALDQEEFGSSLDESVGKVRRLKEIFSTHLKEPHACLVKSIDALLKERVDQNEKINELEKKTEEAEKVREAVRAQVDRTDNIMAKSESKDRDSSRLGLRKDEHFTEEGAYNEESALQSSRLGQTQKLGNAIEARIDEELNYLKSSKLATAEKIIDVLQNLKSLAGSLGKTTEAQDDKGQHKDEDSLGSEREGKRLDLSKSPEVKPNRGQYNSPTLTNESYPQSQVITSEKRIKLEDRVKSPDNEYKSSQSNQPFNENRDHGRHKESNYPNRESQLITREELADSKAKQVPGKPLINLQERLQSSDLTTSHSLPQSARNGKSYLRENNKIYTSDSYSSEYLVTPRMQYPNKQLFGSPENRYFVSPKYQSGLRGELKKSETTVNDTLFNLSGDTGASHQSRLESNRNKRRGDFAYKRKDLTLQTSSLSGNIIHSFRSLY